MKKLMKLIIKLTIIVLVVIILILSIVTGIVYYYQDTMIFGETKFPPGKVYDVPSNYETVIFTTEEGYKYKCWYATCEYPETSATVYYILGNGSFKEDYRITINFYNYYIGVNVFMCSTRGSGDYEGRPNEPLLYKDADMFFRYINRRVGKNPLFMHGRSMGGAVAVEMALRYQKYLNGLALENTFRSIPKVAKEVHPILFYFLFGFQYLLRTKMSSETKIPHIYTPTLFLISAKDKVVNPKHMEALYELSGSQNKHKFVHPNGTHQSVISGVAPEFIKTYTQFIQQYSYERNVEDIEKLYTNSKDKPVQVTKEDKVNDPNEEKEKVEKKVQTKVEDKAKEKVGDKEKVEEKAETNKKPTNLRS